MKTNIIKKAIIGSVLASGILTTVGIVENTTTASASTKYKIHKVKKGESLYSVAKKHKTTVTQIKKINKLKSNVLRVGQKLKYKGTITKVSKAKKTSNKKVKKVSNYMGNKYLEKGKRYLGTPYVWGGTSSRGLDCSGFIYRTLKDSGKNVSRLTSGGLYAKYKHISKSQLDKGDLIFFAESGSRITHVAFYYGNGKILHSAGSKVQINNINNGYWSSRIVGYATID